jgi:hypothetical protein
MSIKDKELLAFSNATNHIKNFYDFKRTSYNKE